VQSHDDDTLRFYAEHALTYAAAGEGRTNHHLDAFLDRLPPGARVLELGCGGGRDAAHILGRGFDVVATDGSPELAAIATARLGRSVRVLRFDELADVAAYDGVWASACLLHVRADHLAPVLALVRRALRPGGRFAASYKAGDGEGRDRFGRYFNFPSRQALEAAYAEAGPWTSIRIEHADGGGYDRIQRTWLMVEAVR
jgi:SAM-dependent methyltransferase